MRPSSLRIAILLALAIGLSILTAGSSRASGTAGTTYRAIGVNGDVVVSTVSQDNADSLAQAQWLANPAYVGAGDYVGFDANPRLTNPADLVLIYGATKASAEVAAKAWGTRLVRGGVWLATSLNGLAVVVSNKSAADARSIAANSGPGGASLLHATASSGQRFYSPSNQQWADNLAAYVHTAPRGVPKHPETCFHSSNANTITLRSWQCPAHWHLLKPAS